MTITDEMVEAYIAKFREFWPGSHPTKEDAKLLLKAALAAEFGDEENPRYTTKRLQAEIARAEYRVISELFGSSVMTVPRAFRIGQPVEKFTGDYTAKGEVRGIFAMKSGPVRYVVEHQAEGGGSFCHIYSEKNLRPQQPHRIVVNISGTMTDAHVNKEAISELIAKARAAYDAMSPEEKAKHDQAQRESFARANISTGNPRFD